MPSARSRSNSGAGRFTGIFHSVLRNPVTPLAHFPATATRAEPISKYHGSGTAGRVLLVWMAPDRSRLSTRWLRTWAQSRYASGVHGSGNVGNSGGSTRNISMRLIVERVAHHLSAIYIAALPARLGPLGLDYQSGPCGARRQPLRRFHIQCYSVDLNPIDKAAVPPIQPIYAIWLTAGH